MQNVSEYMLVLALCLVVVCEQLSATDVMSHTHNSHTRNTCYMCDTTLNFFLFSAAKDIGQDIFLNCHNVIINNLNGFLFYAATKHTAVTFVYLCYVCDNQLISHIQMCYVYFR